MQVNIVVNKNIIRDNYINNSKMEYYSPKYLPSNVLDIE
jgi:hypothetical protein